MNILLHLLFSLALLPGVYALAAGHAADAKQRTPFQRTRVIGYSQVGQPHGGWFVAGGVFESIVGNDRWELLWHGGATAVARAIGEYYAQNANAAPTAVRQPTGLFVCRGPGPTPEREVNFPFIGGWLVRPGWHRVEPKEGQFDWGYIDGELAQAKRLHKKITLCVLGGPQAPEWVYDAGAGSFTSRFGANRKYGKKTDREIKIPVLWDETYLAKWTALVLALGRQYGGEEAVALVHITGATANGLEMQLPFMPQDREKWRQLGYSAAKATAAWQRIVDAYAEAFPGKPLDIDVHPVLGSDKVAKNVAAYGSAKLGRRFGVFGGWLNGKPAEKDSYHAPMYALAAKYGPKGFCAFQMIGNQTRQPERFAEGGLKAAFEQGMKWNARYFEIWEVDALNRELHPMLSEISWQLNSTH